jgi:hypothetical protein
VAREIPATSFVTPGASEFAHAIDRGDIQSLEAIPPAFRELAASRSADESVYNPSTILEQMSFSEAWLEIIFKVHGRVPLLSNVLCTPFGGVRKVELIAGRSTVFDSWTTELVGVRIEVPILELGDRDPNEPEVRIVQRNGGYVLELPEFNRARSVLDHILTTLRLHFVDVRYSDHRGDLGVPHRMRVHRAFKDGSRESRSTLRYYGHLVQGTPGPNIAATPLAIHPDSFKDAFDEAADEIALLGDANVLGQAEFFRRMALIVESAFSDPLSPPGQESFEVDPRNDPRLAALVNSPEFVGRAWHVLSEKPDWVTAYPTPGDFARDWVDVRDKVSHLQKHRFSGPVLQGKTGRHGRYGLAVYDEDFSSLLQQINPIAAKFAADIVRAKVPHLSLEPYHQRKASAEELLSLLESESYFIEPLATQEPYARQHVRAILLHRLRDGERAGERGERFVLAELEARDANYHVYLAEIAAEYSERTRIALLAALRPSDLLSEVAVRHLTRRREEYPQAYDSMEDRLLNEPALQPLLKIHDDTERELRQSKGS